jgi:hypothetical protein
MPTMGWFNGWPPVEPSKPASPKPKMPRPRRRASKPGRRLWRLADERLERPLMPFHRSISADVRVCPTTGKPFSTRVDGPAPSAAQTTAQTGDAYGST